MAIDTVWRGALLAVVILAAGVTAQAAAEDRSGAVQRGRARFQQWCVVCHDQNGGGKGQARSALNPRPADLRLLTRQNSGIFPAARVEAVLKGQDQAAGHSGAMATWGAMFLGDANGDQAIASSNIADVIAFITSIQK